MSTFQRVLDILQEKDMDYDIKEVNISEIKPYDTVEHEGIIKTVSKKDIKKDDLMGITLFGDSYKNGKKPVKKVIIKKAMPKK